MLAVSKGYLGSNSELVPSRVYVGKLWKLERRTNDSLWVTGPELKRHDEEEGFVIHRVFGMEYIPCKPKMDLFVPTYHTTIYAFDSDEDGQETLRKILNMTPVSIE